MGTFIRNGITFGGGGSGEGIVPHIVIITESGSVVRLIKGSNVIYATETFTGHFEADVPEFGNWIIHSVYEEVDETVNLLVDTVKVYTIDDSHFHSVINATFTEGATCKLYKGEEMYYANINPFEFVVHSPGTWHLESSIDGMTITSSVTITADGQTVNKSIVFGSIALTYNDDFKGLPITCSNGSDVSQKVAPMSGNSLMFYPSEVGTWTISGIVDEQEYSTEVEVADLSVQVSATLMTIPEGSTVTPTDDITTWLACANITDKSYTTLAEVLADRETFETLIADSNACDYMARSTTWALAEGLVPTMTDNTHPSGEAFSSYNSSDGAYKAFDNNWSTFDYAAVLSNAIGSYIGYDFGENTKINRISFRSNYTNGNEYKVQGYDTEWHDITSFIANGPVGQGDNVSAEVEVVFSQIPNYSKYRVYQNTKVTTSTNTGIFTLQFYEADITTNKDAMSLIGKYDYCSNALLSNATWLNAIANSDYFEEVLNVKVPVMTSNTTPSGEASASNTYSSGYPWKAFNGTNVGDFDGWIANFSSAYIPAWICYEFDNPVCVKKVYFENRNYSGDDNVRIKTYKVQASNDNFVSDIHDLTDLITRDDSKNVPKGSDTLILDDNVDAYTSYRLYITERFGGQGSHVGCAILQFYGRKPSSVSNTNGIIHTANGDTVTCNGNTYVADVNGIIDIDFSDFDEGTYTFTSGIAKDPTDLSNYYSKSFKITKSPYGGTTELYLMPDAVKTLYWWGYVGEELTSSGWTYSNISTPQNAPTYNTTDITLICNNNGNSASFVGTSNTKHLTKVNAIGYCTSTGSALGRVSVGSTKDAGSQTFETLPLNTIGLASYTATEGDYYIGISTYYVTTQSKFNALWYE